jgi:hypothetical protein
MNSRLKSFHDDDSTFLEVGQIYEK